jgi:hypothetical protein
MSSIDLKAIQFNEANLPTFEEVKNNRDWIFWGSDNLWPNHSIDLYNYSSILRSALNSVIDGVIGKDLLLDGITADRYMANSTETVYDVYKKVATDFVIHNGLTLNTLLRRDGEGISEFYHMDISKIRTGKADEYDRVKGFYFSSDWTNVRKYKPVYLPTFDLNTDTPSQVYYYKTYQPSQFYYPVNSWIGARYAAEIDVEIKNYHLRNLQNGYHSGAIFSMNNGIPSEEERESVYRHLEEKYTSTNQAGNIIVTFSEDKEHAPEITPFANGATADMFIQLNEMVNQTILTAVRISNPSLLGIKTVQGLGSKDELKDAYEHFLATLIEPLQQKINKEFTKVLFYKDKKQYDITNVQNTLFDDKNVTITEE